MSVEGLKERYSKLANKDQIFEDFDETIEEINDYYKMEGKICDLVYTHEDVNYCLGGTPEECREHLVKRVKESILTDVQKKFLRDIQIERAKRGLTTIMDEEIIRTALCNYINHIMNAYKEV